MWKVRNVSNAADYQALTGSLLLYKQASLVQSDTLCSSTVQEA
jgi:hypothetical protein